MIVDKCPFETLDNPSHAIRADIEGDLFPIYNPIFTKFGLSGNGYSWEGVVIQVLEQEHPELLQKIQFDPEAGGFYAFAENKDVQLKFMDVLCPIFQDTKLLEQFLSSIDRTQIDD